MQSYLDVCNTMPGSGNVDNITESMAKANVFDSPSATNGPRSTRIHHPLFSMEIQVVSIISSYM